MTIGRQGIDVASAHIERKSAQPLYGIYQKYTLVAWQISPIASIGAR